MDERLRALCRELARMSSAQAANWLMSEYPLSTANWGEALLLMPHRSWKRSEQKILARYYFKKIPFAQAKGYETFASFMSIPLLLECLMCHLPMAPEKNGLFIYHVAPVLKEAARNEVDHRMVIEFLDQINNTVNECL